jgi:hypothetical protein
MTTFIGALRFAVNVEHLLRERQKELFRTTGDTSAMFLPPLIPVAATTTRPDLHDLDVFRKRHYLRVVPGSTSDAAVIDGFSEMVVDYAAQFGPETMDTPWVPNAGIRDMTVRLSWGEKSDRLSSEFSGIPLPETSALWLSLFRIEWTSRDRWWSGGRWDLMYSRRFTNRPHPPENPVLPR